MASIDGKEEHDAFNTKREEKNPPPPKQVPKTAPVANSSNSNMKKQPQNQKKIKGKAPATKPYSQGYRIPNIQQYALENVFHMAGTMMELQKNVEGEYAHIEFIRGIDIIKEDLELPDILVTPIFNTLFTKSAHRWYIKLRQAHGHQIWTWWKSQIINKWANDAWRFKVETSFDSAKFNSDKDKALPWFCQQKHILTALYPDMSEFMIHRKILRQCGAEDISNILEEVTTRTRRGSSGVNLKTRFNKPWKDSVDKNPKENSNNLREAEISLHLTNKKENELSSLLYDHSEAFASDKEPLGAVIGHEADIILNIERPYPPLLRRPAYPANPQSREAVEIHIKELLDLGLIRNLGHNEEVEITTPVIVAWHNGKSRMVGIFGALNTYTVPGRYPIPKIQIALPRYLKQCI
ncbi:hypothetical protein O181_085213 [Austropuccinia psidii MF-1]|uniref:Uncharacterized protein n=1 Tax=Austropuccinia psidii MF-1 TaxID=1389203 RepID=A0A9Q3ILC3_9BASI|nr:hypothetical protein [Austropuccinia psidii MF-1]